MKILKNEKINFQELSAPDLILRKKFPTCWGIDQILDARKVSHSISLDVLAKVISFMRVPRDSENLSLQPFDVYLEITLAQSELRIEAVTSGDNQHLVEVESPPQTDIRHSSRIPPPKKEFNFNDPKLNGDIKIAIADSTSFNDTLEDSRASSVASIHQITEALKRKSFISEPRRAIEHLLSVGS